LTWCHRLLTWNLRLGWICGHYRLVRINRLLHRLAGERLLTRLLRLLTRLQWLIGIGVGRLRLLAVGSGRWTARASGSSDDAVARPSRRHV
jgi:hypothetical protein